MLRASWRGCRPIRDYASSRPSSGDIMLRAALIVLLIALLPACASQRALPHAAGERLLVTIHYDVADTQHGDPADRYLRPASYGAGPGAEPVLNALAAEYALTRVSGWPMRALGVHCEVFAVARGADAD